MKSVNLNEIKNKFGYLLSYARLQCQMSDASINARIEQSDYFDFLENGYLDDFLLKDIPDICFNEFKVKTRNHSDTFLNEYVYAGECYISISICLSIPLRKLFLLFPLEKMVMLFPTYHEMSPFRIIERVNEEISKVTAFKIIVGRSGYSILTLSKITNIDRNYLSRLLNNPLEENKLTNNQITILSKALNISEIFFKKSTFVPYYYSLFNNDIFVTLFLEELKTVLAVSVDVVFDKTRNNNNTRNDRYLYVTPEEASIYKKGKLIKKIPNQQFDLSLFLAINKYKEYCFNNKKAFC